MPMIPAVAIKDPKNVTPFSTRPMNVLSWCCSTFNSARVWVTRRTARRGAQRGGSHPMVHEFKLLGDFGQVPNKLKFRSEGGPDIRV